MGDTARFSNTYPKKEIKDEGIRLLRAVRHDAHNYDRLPRQLSEWTARP